MYFYGIENDDCFGTYNCSLDMTIKDVLQKSIASIASRSASEESATRPILLQRVPPYPTEPEEQRYLLLLHRLRTGVDLS